MIENFADGETERVWSGQRSRRLPSDIQSVALHKLRMRGVTADTDLRLARYFGMSDGFFLGLQSDYGLLQRRRELGEQLEGIQPRAHARA